jgi:hypothetical protein
VAALEAAVQHVAVGGLRGKDGDDGGRQRRIAGGAIGGAQVQVGQPPFEQPGQFAPDAVAVEQHDMAVFGLHARQLGGQRVVVGLPPAHHALLHLGRRRCLAVAVDRLAGKRARRAQLGVVAAGIHGLVVAGPVEVDHITAVARHQQAGAAVLHEGIQAVEKPVGVLDAERALDIAAAQLVGDHGAHVRQAHHQRRAAAVQGMDIGRHRGRSTPPWKARRQGLWPKR